MEFTILNELLNSFEGMFSAPVKHYIIILYITCRRDSIGGKVTACGRYIPPKNERVCLLWYPGYV